MIPDYLEEKNETYSDYLANITHPKVFAKSRWLYEIFMGSKTDEEILISNYNFICITPSGWKSTDNPENMHLLSFIHPSLNQRTIRDLTADDISLLEGIKLQTLSFIKGKFGFEENEILIYFHYLPSCYVTHIHFEKINEDTKYPSNLILYEDVINNLKTDSLYYRNNDMTIYVPKKR